MSQLYDAVQEGEKERLDQIIQKVADLDSGAAGALKQLAEHYDYDALTRLLQDTRRESLP